MSRIITYSLRSDDLNSNDYYQEVSLLKDRWLVQTLPEVKDLISDFRAYRDHTAQDNRSEAEYAFELLVIGVFLYKHGTEAARLPGWIVSVLSTLQSAQSRWSLVEPILKSPQGLISGIFWGKTSEKSIDFPRLLAWLRAYGENGVANRLAQWQEYIMQANSKSSKSIIKRYLQLAIEFEKMADPVLGKYTQGIPRFLKEDAPTYRWRYDNHFVSRTRLEYHLGMLGSELLNAAYRKAFQAVQNRVVIVPPCMRARSEEECKAISTSLGMLCQGCTPSCRIHQITQLGIKYEFKVFMIPDELRL